MDPTDTLSYLIFPMAPTLAVALKGPNAAEALRVLAQALRTPPSTVSAEAGAILQVIEKDVAAVGSQLNGAEAYWRATHSPATICDPCELATRHDATVRWLAYIVTGGFFLLIAMLGYFSSNASFEGNNPLRDVLIAMAGVLGTGWASVVSFYFGSSVGSRTQNTTLSSIAAGTAQAHLVAPPAPLPAPPAPTPRASGATTA